MASCSVCCLTYGMRTAQASMTNLLLTVASRDWFIIQRGARGALIENVISRSILTVKFWLGMVLDRHLLLIMSQASSLGPS